MKHEKKLYPCFAYRQRDNAPLQVAFVATSIDIDRWARVPTKRTGNVRNFQRAAIAQHVKEVERFFADSTNASPTAVVIGFDPLRASGHVSLFDHAGIPVDAADVGPGAPRALNLAIEWATACPDDGTLTPEEFITGRLPFVERIILAELQDVTGIEAERLERLLDELRTRARRGLLFDPEASVDEQDDDSEDDADYAQLSISSQQLMAGLSPSERQILIGRLEFVCQLDAEILRQASHETKTELAFAVADELKPGILIDGQHRVMGTKSVGEVPFLVCGLPMADWPELAFQFLVTNRTARRVQESLLINIVGNSLSQRQRSMIESRLRDAGIRVGLIEAVMKVHEDESSPFYGMLSFGLKGEQGFIDAAAMRNKVIKPWFDRRDDVDRLFDHLCAGAKKRERTEYWQAEELWFDQFIAFWSAVRERYQGSQVFSDEVREDSAKKEPVSSLMTATVLKIFQEAVLRNIFEYVIQKQQKDNVSIAVSLPDSSAFRQMVINTLSPLTPEFFQGWNLSGFDGSASAKTDLSEAITLVISKTKTVAQLKSKSKDKRHRLFKEKP